MNEINKFFTKEFNFSEKAKIVHKKIGGSENFVASSGWLDWWKKKYEVCLEAKHSKHSIENNFYDDITAQEMLDKIIVNPVLEETTNYEENFSNINYFLLILNLILKEKSNVFF